MRTSNIEMRLIGAALLGGLVVITAGFAARPLVLSSTTYPWVAAAVFAVMMSIALPFASQHPFERLGPANQVTVIRAMLAALIVALIGEVPTMRVAQAAVVAATVFAVLDGVDGWLARRSRMASVFGARFDMETDALVILALSVLVWRHDKAGVWVLACGLMRYAFVAAGWLLPWIARPLTPTVRGKAVAVAQVVGLCAALVVFVPPASILVAAMTLAALSWSFAIDIRRLWRQRAGLGSRD